MVLRALTQTVIEHMAYPADMHDDDGVRPRVTLAEVAKEAGVSLPTVSKVLNGRSDVSRATRARIEQLLDAHGYRRRKPGAPRSPLIELVFHELDSVWAMEIVRGVETVAQENQATVVLTRSGTRHAPAPDWIEGVLRRRPLGVVLVFSSLPEEVKRRLAAQAIPFVIIDPAGDPDPYVPSVGSANWAGGLAATRHLTDHGHERIAIITGPEDMLCSLARLDGYRSAMAMAGLAIDPRLVRFGDFQVQGGFEHAMDLLDGPGRPTAVFAGSDLQALGVLEAARIRNLRVPQDLSVVGYDDVPLAQWSSPPLTTVHQPLRQMAEEATRMLLRPDDPGKAAQRIELATHLVVRQSTAPHGGGPELRPADVAAAVGPAADALSGAGQGPRGGGGG
ncbi:Ribose operon repressor [Streptomyces sp. enrichment culture]